MTTTPVYMTDPYARNLDAKIIRVIDENVGQYKIILDQTIFYPMGGGQATDQGKIILQDGKELEVFQVMLMEGEIYHFAKSSFQPSENIQVKLEINWDRRFKNMQLHTAGHIIDFAMFRLGYSPNKLTPLKGDHNKNPHIVYKGFLDFDIKDALQAEVDKITNENLEFEWEFGSFDMLKEEAIYLQPNLPTGKPLRILRLKGVGAVADGGTILRYTNEVGGIIITDVKTEDGSTTVYYGLKLK